MDYERFIGYYSSYYLLELAGVYSRLKIATY
jgi:hypothetical protein